MAFEPRNRGRLRVRDGWRGEACATVMAELVPGLSLSGRALVIDDDNDAVASALRDAGVAPLPWYRRALHGHTATAWPAPDPADIATIRLPSSRDALDLLLHAAAARLAPGGQVFVYGTNDEGIRSTARWIEAVFGATRTLDTRRHSRVLAATRPPDIPELRAALDDWRTTFTIELPDGRLDFVSYPGVFAHGKLDAGTRVLLDAMPTPPPGARVLDFGCGAGLVAAVVHHRAPSAQLDLLDVFAPATAVARLNVPTARIFLGDAWTAIDPSSRYDLILSNPPIHTGVGEDYRVLTALIEQSPDHLTPAGELWLVVQRTVPLQDLLAAAFTRIDEPAGNSQFRVWRARSPRRRRRDGATGA
jgi:16S rRNA (guanine1207-N2)-methyltransferase